MERKYNISNTLLTCQGNSNSLITNNYGGYFAILPNSKYSGWYLLDAKQWKMKKIIDSINPIELGNQISTSNQFFSIRRQYEKGEDSIFTYNNTLFYNAQKTKGKIKLTLDNREIYEGSELGRTYAFKQEENYFVIEFRNAQNEQSFIAIKGIENVNILNSWREQQYQDDKKRHSNFIYWVYDSIDFTAKSNVVFSFGETLAIAKTRADIAFFHFNEILNFKHTSFLNSTPEFNKITYSKLKTAGTCAFSSLNSLTNVFSFKHNQMIGIYAGLPWFFHLWSRDELISLGGFISLSEQDVELSVSKSMNLQNNNDNHILVLIKTILSRHINSIESTGRLQNIYPLHGLPSIDAFGWLGKRTFDFITDLTNKKILFEILSDDDLRIWFDKLFEGLQNAKQNYGQQGLFANGFCETWMDTTSGDEGRPGYCIEIQTLFLSIYDSLILLAKLINSEKQNILKQEREEFAKQIKEIFFAKNYDAKLLDRVYPRELLIDQPLNQDANKISSLILENLKQDPTTRPNIFLSAYLSQDLFSKREWEPIFDKYLDELYLPWGGIATLPSTHSLYQPIATGEDNRSYHRGDSWYFLNNITAIVLHRINPEKYKKQIFQILTASTKDILEQGVIGHASEISSAQQQESSGTGAQAWSAATYLELLNEIYK